jgi:hypothetical protein
MAGLFMASRLFLLAIELTRLYSECRRVLFMKITTFMVVRVVRTSALLCVMAFCIVQTLVAQTRDNDTRHVALSDFTFVSPELKEKGNNRISRTVFTHLALTQQNKSYWDSLLLVSSFSGMEGNDISLHGVKMRIAPFDTQQLSVAFVVYQPTPGDTVLRSFPIPTADIRKSRLTLRLSGDPVILKPGIYYMGFQLIIRNVPEMLKYRIYTSDKGIRDYLRRKDGVFQETHSPPGAFPFKISYSVL